MHAKHVKKALLQAYRIPDSGREKDTAIHVSSLKNFCPRAFVLCRDAGKPFVPSRFHPPAVRYIFHMGHHIQEMMIENFKATDFLVGTWLCGNCGWKHVAYYHDGMTCPVCASLFLTHVDTKIILKRRRYTIVGNIDIPMLSEDRRTVFINEAKSINKADYDSLESPLVDHVTQVGSYMWMLQKKAKPGDSDPFGIVSSISTTDATISYACKGNARDPFKVFDVTVADRDRVGKKNEEKLSELDEALKAKATPNRICENPGNLMARECSARLLCFPGSGF